MGDTRDFLKRWQEQGWIVTRTNGGHLKFTHAEVPNPVFHGSTPSDIRAAKNHDAMLRRMLRQARGGETIQARNAASSEGVVVIRKPLPSSRKPAGQDFRELPNTLRANEPPHHVSPEDFYDEGFYEEPVRHVEKAEPAPVVASSEPPAPPADAVVVQPVHVTTPEPAPEASVDGTPEPAPVTTEAPEPVPVVADTSPAPLAPEPVLAPRKRGRPPKVRTADVADATAVKVPKRRGPAKPKHIPVMPPVPMEVQVWTPPPSESAHRPSMSVSLRPAGVGLFHERRAAERRARRRGMI